VIGLWTATAHTTWPPTGVWSPLSDEALLAGFAAGDPEVAAAFVRRFQSRVFGLALTLLGDRGEAEEAAQDAFLRAWRYADSYDPRRGSVATWLLVIARNVAIDHARIRRADPVDPAVLLGSAVDPAAQPDEHRIAADEAARVRAAIDTLPADQRRALVLAAFFGRTAREIAALDDAPLGTVKTRIRAAMLKLHGALEVQDA
jgi:RNA polymerase sigma factor (sigma-70 family)